MQQSPWTNNAKNNAGVICCIVGLRHIKNNKKLLINEQVTNEVSNINAYLVEGKSTIVEKKQKPISKLTQMATGNIPYDGGHLILSNEEKINILNKHPDASRLIRPFIGSSEYIRGETRWCLWISDDDLQLANSIPEISERILKVAESRKMGGKIAKNYENVPHRFYMINTATNSQILVPRVSSIRRDYIPIGYVTPEAIIADSAQAIYDPEPEVFSLITSKMHMIWVRTLAGRLKNDYRYSAILCYNTFPVPKLTQHQRNKLIELGFNIIAVREEFSHLTLAELYDPNKMPDKLRVAHIENDNYVENCYKKSGFSNDEQRLEYLINLYVEMTG
ncbi:type IIL restriction-modification enzyme MmeI [Acinetobacter baumannii]